MGFEVEPTNVNEALMHESRWKTSKINITNI